MFPQNTSDHDTNISSTKPFSLINIIFITFTAITLCNFVAFYLHLTPIQTQLFIAFASIVCLSLFYKAIAANINNNSKPAEDHPLIHAWYNDSKKSKAILNSDLMLISANSVFKDMFKNANSTSKFLDLIDNKIIPEQQLKKIIDAIETLQSLDFSFYNQDLNQKINVSINPLSLATSKIPQYFELSLSLGKPDIETKDFENLLNDQSIAIYSVNEEGYFDYCNNYCAEKLGYTTEELIGKIKIDDLRSPIKEIKFGNYDSKHDNSFSLLKKDGNVINVVIEQISVKDSLDKVKIYNLLNLSNNDRNVLSNEYLWYFVECSPIAKALINEHGKVERFNTSFKTIFSINDSNPLDWNFFDIIHEEDKATVTKLLNRAINSKGSPVTNFKAIEVRIVNGKKELTVLLYINRLIDPNSNAVIYMCDLIDTTEQKNLEMHFVHSQKMQAVGQLAGGIAHDFNNLLTAMIGFCDLLLIRHPAGDQSFADIMQIKQNSNRAANLVRQLLAFSRKQVLCPKVMDITGVLAESSNLVRRLIGENIKFNIIHGRDLGLVRVDQGQLEQVIINLAVNARDAMLNGGLLTIQTKNVTVNHENPLCKSLISPFENEQIEDGQYVLIEVTDNGCGIPKQLISKIFEPFFSTKEIGAGTGLGLSTVYGIVKQTGGYIYITSEPNKGTTFSIFLKACDSKEYNNLESDRDIDQIDKAVNADLTGKGTILLVEDEAPVRIFGSHALMNKGYKVYEADSGEAALSIIEQHGNEIDIIISDVIMPGMNGPRLIEEIIGKFPHIKVIFMSGYAEDALVKTYGVDGKFNFLAKPFTLKQLAGKVKEILSKELIH